jgi:hypothetical protein
VYDDEFDDTIEDVIDRFSRPFDPSNKTIRHATAHMRGGHDSARCEACHRGKCSTGIDAR